jgi:hypothetical protein
MNLHKPKMSCRSFICGHVDDMVTKLAKVRDKRTLSATAKIYWWDGSMYMTEEQSHRVRAMWLPIGTEYDRSKVRRALESIGYPSIEAARRTSVGVSQ